MSEDKENQKPNEELSKEDLEKVTGGGFAVSVPGESLDDKHKDWIEI